MIMGSYPSSRLLRQRLQNRLLHPSLGRQQQQKCCFHQYAPLRLPFTATLPASGTKSCSCVPAILKPCIKRSSPPSIRPTCSTSLRYASTTLQPANKQPPPPQRPHSPDHLRPEGGHEELPTPVKRFCYLAPTLRKLRTRSDSPFRVAEELDRHVTMEEIRGRTIRTDLNTVHKFLEDLLEVAEEIGDVNSQHEFEALFPIVRHLVDVCLLLKRRTESASLPVDGTEQAGVEILRLVPSLEDSVRSQALRGVGYALKGDLRAAMIAIDRVVDLARPTITKELEKAEGLNVECYPYADDMSSLLQAVIECALESAIDKPFSGRKLPHRRFLLRKEMNRIRTSLDTTSPGVGVLAASEKLKRLLRYLLSRSLILPFASRKHQQTQQAFDDLLASLTRLDLQEIIDVALADEDKKICTQALLAIGFGLARLERIDEMLSVYVKSDQAGIKLPERFTRKLLRMCSKESPIADLRTLMDIFQRQAVDPLTGLIHMEEKSYLVLGSYLGMIGQVERLHLLWQRLSEQYPNHDASWAFKQNFLQAYGRSNFDLFEPHLHKNWIIPGTGEVNSRKKEFDDMTYLIVIKTYVLKGRMEEAERYLQLLDPFKQRNILPQAHNAFLSGYTRRYDVTKAASIWASMLRNGPEPKRHTYELFIELFAKRGDLKTAFDFLRLMQEHGFRPSSRILPFLLSKLVRAGEFAQAEALFRSMLSNPHVRVDIRAWTSMLESLVYRNAPFEKVLSAFEEIKRQGFRPAAKTYTILMLSACEAGAIRRAEEIFAEADSMAANPGADDVTQLSPEVQMRDPGEGEQQGEERELPQLQTQLDDLTESLPGEPLRIAPERRTYVSQFSLLIYTHLRRGNVIAAKEYFDELQRRNVPVPAKLWSILIKGYVHSGTEANMRLARDIILRQLGEIEDDKTDSEDHDSESQHRERQAQLLYAPLLNYSAKQGDSERVEAILSELESIGVNLSLPMLSITLDCYRQRNDLSMMIPIWHRIFKTATAQLRLEYDFATSSSRDSTRRLHQLTDADFRLGQVKVGSVQRNALCIPLSIMLDVLSAENRHQDVAELWKSVRSAGFAFDPYNWNQLAATLASAGRTEDALRIVEKVLNQLTPAAEVQLLIVRGRQGDRRGLQETAAKFEDHKATSKKRREVKEDEKVGSPSRARTRLQERRTARGQYFTGEQPRYRRQQNELFRFDAQHDGAEGEARGDEDGEGEEEEGDGPEEEDKREILRILDEQNLLDKKRPFWKAHRTTLSAIEASLEKYGQEVSEARELSSSATSSSSSQERDPSDPFGTGRSPGPSSGQAAGQESAEDAVSTLLAKYPRAAEILQVYRIREGYFGAAMLSGAEKRRRTELVR